MDKLIKAFIAVILGAIALFVVIRIFLFVFLVFEHTHGY